MEALHEIVARILPPPGYENHLVVDRDGTLYWMLREDMRSGDMLCFYDGDCRDVKKYNGAV